MHSSLPTPDRTPHDLDRSTSVDVDPAAWTDDPPDTPATRLDWVDAAPFRAHVAHLMAAADLTPEALAGLAGVPVGATRALAARRGRRPVRRVHAEIARRLLRVTTQDARWVHRTPVAVTPSRLRLRSLLRGTDADTLAVAVGVTDARLADLLGPAEWCTQAEALRIQAVHRRMGGPDPALPAGRADAAARAA